MRYLYKYPFSFRHSLALAMLLLALPATSKTIKVSTAAQLKVAVEKAQPGDDVVIANGRYHDWSCKFTGNGSADKPVVIKPETAGGVIFMGTVNQSILVISGQYVQLTGLVFQQCTLIKSASTPLLIELKGDHCRITDCTFERNEAKSQFMPIVSITGTGEANRVDHCQFKGNVNNMELQVRVAAGGTPQHTLVDHNEFMDKPRVTWPVFNGGECVQIGQDPVLLGTQSANALVRDNRFIRCKGEGEVISNKSSNNKYINNYLEDCDGELVMRGGHDCLVDSNTIKGGDCGIRVNGSGHTITNNSISGTQNGIRLMYGMAKGKSEVGFYIAPSGCRIQNNKISNVKTGILIGDNKNQDWTGKFDVKRYPSRVMQDVPPADNVINNNSITNAEIPIKQIDNK